MGFLLVYIFLFRFFVFCLSLSCVVVYVPSGLPRSPLAGKAEVAAGDALDGRSLDG